MGGVNRVGRKSKLTPELQAELITYLEAGNYAETACHAVGINPNTMYQWMRIGNSVIEELGDEFDLDGPKPGHLSDHHWNCVGFAIAVTKASARSEAYAVAIVRKHMPEQWTAAMTFLERRFPRRWKRRQGIDVGEDEGPRLEEAAFEKAILDNPEAVALLHKAMEVAATGLLDEDPKPVDVEVVETTEEPS